MDVYVSSRKRLRLIAIPVLLVLFGLITGAKCYPPGTRVVVFIQGLYTTYDTSGTQGTVGETHRFEAMKAAFLAKGYAASSLLDFSYAGGTVGADGAWHPADYGCEITDRSPDQNLAPLEKMLKDYRTAHPTSHITLVGHSLGGYLAFLEGARDAARASSDKLGVDVVVTLDAPLKGVSADKKIIIDILPCDKTYIAGGDLVASKADPSTPDVRRYQAAIMAREGVRLATLGNEFDCLYSTNHCVAGGAFSDDGSTQYLEGEASISTVYRIEAPAFLSHDAIVSDPTVVRDAAAFVGAP